MLQSFFVIGFLVSATLSLSAQSKAGEQKFVAILIWGTDGEKPQEKDKELKDVDADLKKTFENIFKWKNYYEVSRTNVTVKPGEPREINLSSKCVLKINHTEDKGTQVELFGEKKSV